MAVADPLGNHLFPKTERLRTDREYREVVRGGERATTPHFTVYRDFSGSAGTSCGAAGGKIGISVGKRVGKAVLRNRIRRLLREFYRNHKEFFPSGSRTAIVVRKAPPEENLSSIGQELREAISRRWGRKEGGSHCGQMPS